MRFNNNLLLHKLSYGNVLIRAENGVIDLTTLYFISPVIESLYRHFKKCEFEDSDVFGYLLSEYEVDISTVAKDWRAIKGELLTLKILL